MARNNTSRKGGIRLVPGLDIRAGQTLAGKYRVEELLGSGASGVVLSAHNIWLREPVTLKLLSSYTDGQEELLQRRLAKARLAARLSSRHVARVVDIGLTGDAMPYVATECLKGKTLATELEERGHLEVAESVRWVLEACEGLAEAHALGLVHGDLKPQNIFLAESNDSAERVLKILDFGTTSPLDAIGDQSASAFFGSPAFLAPEQIRDPGSVDARADVWALGVLLYNLVSGALPFAADTVSGVIVAVVYDAAGLLVDAPYELARLVHRCLDKDPANRPQDVGELAAALAPFAGSDGARLSARVRVMLETPPRAALPSRSWLEGLVDACASSSAPPVSMSTDHDERRGSDRIPSAAPIPKEERPTLPSRRVVASRWGSRTRTATYGMLGAVTAIVLGTSFSRAPSTTRVETIPTMLSVAQERLEDSAESARTVFRVPTPASEPTPPAPAPVAAAAVPEKEISFAPTPEQPMMATPLAATPTPLATEEPAKDPTPTPTTTSAPKPSWAAAPAAPLPAPAAKQFLLEIERAERNARNSPAGVKAARDEAYRRKLFSERK